MSIKGNWYLSIAAVRDYMSICGLSGPLEETNVDFLKAIGDLTQLSLSARLADTAKTQSGASIYRGKVTIRGLRQRIECPVQDAVREEGELPQLVRVRLK